MFEKKWVFFACILATVENCVKEIHNLKELVTSQNQLLQQLLPNATYEEFSPITTLEELDKVEADLKEMTYFSKMVLYFHSL